MPKKAKRHQTKTASERLISVNETKMKCIEHNLTDDIATKVLFRMLDTYHRDGTVYINKELTLTDRYDMPRKYVINLWNDRAKIDTVLIRTLDDGEALEQSLAQRQRNTERQTRSVVETWSRDSCSEDDEEAPNLVAS